LPSCCQDHGKNSVLPSTTLLYYDQISNPALSGRFALLASEGEPNTYTCNLHDLKSSVRKLKDAMTSAINEGRYLDTSLTIVAHGSEDGRITIGTKRYDPFQLIKLIRDMLNDAGPALKTVHFDSCHLFASIHRMLHEPTEYTRIQRLGVADVVFSGYTAITEAPSGKTLLQLYQHYLCVAIHQNADNSPIETLVQDAIGHVKNILPEVDLSSAMAKRLQAGMTQKGRLAGKMGSACKRRRASEAGGTSAADTAQQTPQIDVVGRRKTSNDDSDSEEESTSEDDTSAAASAPRPPLVAKSSAPASAPAAAAAASADADAINKLADYLCKNQGIHGGEARHLLQGWSAEINPRPGGGRSDKFFRSPRPGSPRFRSQEEVRKHLFPSMAPVQVSGRKRKA